MKKFAIFILSLGLAVQALAIEEAKLTSNEFLNNILPYVLQHVNRGSFQGVDNKKINYYVMPAAQPKGVIVLSPGQSESSLKYSELLFDWRDLGYTIYVIDHRGQGESDRLLTDPIKSHVVRFSDYVTDFETFVLQVVHPERYSSSFLMAHSMGGTIASGFLIRHPKTFTAAILSAPMLEINTGYPQLGSYVLAAILDNPLLATDYAPTQKPYGTDTFATNIVTSSQARYQLRVDLYDKYKGLRVGGTTNSWLHESLGYTAILRTTKNIYQIPTLMFQAGKDHLVEPRGQNVTCLQNSPQFCKLLLFPTSQHEILMEKDAIRNQALGLIEKFIADHTK